MRKALIIGIDDYSFAPLQGCIKDAQKISNTLSRNYDLSPNFSCKTLLSSEQNITEATLYEALKELFKYEADVVLFYFSGHGHLNDLGGFLVTQDAQKNDPGVKLNDIILLANQSLVKEVIIILDCCYSGEFGNTSIEQNTILKKGFSVLASSRYDQESIGTDEGSIFTSILCNGLEGEASNILGNVSIASLYDYADHLLGPWEQRPIFKSHVSKMISLRNCKPHIDINILRKITTYFKTPAFQFPLSPEFEPTAKPESTEKEAIFAELQKMRAVNLVEPVDEDHLYFAAINNKSCELTHTGRFYWEMVNNNKL